ncbi:MAG: arylesterase [Zymomonas sp.]|nr:MAG: arylesterase [Zymomonas sp.]
MSHGLFTSTLVALSVLFASAGTVVSADARSASRPIRIVAFGDSLTAGYGLRPAQAFPARLQAALRAKGYDVTVANAGVSGNTTSAGLARVQRAVPGGTDLTIVELGANDILRGVPPGTSERNLDAILDHVGKKSPHIVLAGMIAPPGFDNADSRSFDSVFTRLADRHRATLYPFFLKGVAGRRGLNLPDGIHPNAAGVEEIVVGILPTIMRELEAMRVGG